MTYQDRIRSKLTLALAPTLLVIEDKSAKHHGHAGAHAEGETHFKVQIQSAVFIGLTKVEQHRKVYDILTEELAERVHALSLVTSTP